MRPPSSWTAGSRLNAASARLSPAKQYAPLRPKPGRHPGGQQIDRRTSQRSGYLLPVAQRTAGGETHLRADTGDAQGGYPPAQGPDDQPVAQLVQGTGTKGHQQYTLFIQIVERRPQQQRACADFNSFPSQHSVRLDIIERVEQHSVQLQLKVQMGPRGIAGGTREGHPLSRRHGLPLLNQQLAAMGIKLFSPPGWLSWR